MLSYARLLTWMRVTAVVVVATYAIAVIIASTFMLVRGNDLRDAVVFGLAGPLMALDYLYLLITGQPHPFDM
jgi:hypothetical protein